jgi:hypothetical protein
MPPEVAGQVASVRNRGLRGWKKGAGSMRLSRPWPPIHIRMPLHPRVWREDKRMIEAKHKGRMPQ